MRLLRPLCFVLLGVPLSAGFAGMVSRSWRERLRAQRHIRPHVNPLQRRFTNARLPKSFGQSAFAAAQPLHVDIGSGKGHFCADLAAARPDLNVLGIEIRAPLVDEAERLAREEANLRFLAGSANACAAAAIDAVLARGGHLHSLSIQFPDPWKKLRHRKRRVVQPPLVAEVAERLRPGGLVYLQSDVEAVAREMRAAFLRAESAAGPPSFCEVVAAAEGAAVEGADRGLGLVTARGPASEGDGEECVPWLDEAHRPFPGIRTERERQAERRGLAVFRTLLVRQISTVAE